MKRTSLLLLVLLLAGCVRLQPDWTTLIYDVGAWPTETKYVVELSVALITDERLHLDESAYVIEWDTGDGGEEFGATAYHDYVPGEYVVTMTATDAVGRKTVDTFPLLVGDFGTCFLQHRDGMGGWSEDAVYQLCLFGWR